MKEGPSPGASAVVKEPAGKPVETLAEPDTGLGFRRVKVEPAGAGGDKPAEPPEPPPEEEEPGMGFRKVRVEGEPE